MKLNKKEPFEVFVSKHMDILGPILDKIEVPNGEKRYTLSVPSKLRSTLSFSPSKISPILYAKHRAEKLGLNVEEAVSKAKEALEKEKAHAKKVHNHPRNIKLTCTNFKEGQLMPLNQAKIIFWNDYLCNSVKKSKKNPEGKFNVDESNSYEIGQLLKYFIQDPSCKYDLDKGICIHGPVGSGKTHLLNMFSSFVSDAGFHNSFTLVSMKDVNLEVAKDLDALNRYKTSNFCFDEVVAKQVNCYGTTVIPIDEIIQGQYNRFLVGNGKKMHITSNINLNPTHPREIEILKEMYDIRSIDRLRQMCNFVYLGGQSRRQ